MHLDSPANKPGQALPTLPQILDGKPPANRGPVRLEREPFAGYEYSGGGVTVQELALSEAVGKPFAHIAQESVLKPLGMTDSTFEQPLPAPRVASAAHSHDGSGAATAEPWRVHPELAAAGLWTTPTDLAKFVIEVQQSVRGKSNRVLSTAMAREMISPVGVGDFAIGFSVLKIGEGWYFLHDGANFGFQSYLVGHFSKGHGAVIMTNSNQGRRLIDRLLPMIYEEFGWDAGAKPVPRGYGPMPPTK